MGEYCMKSIWAQRWTVLAQCVCFLAVTDGARAANGEIVRGPQHPREFYNEGTLRLREGKLRDAEADLQIAVASNNDRLQPSALYNLGHVRFRSGMEALKEMADQGPTRTRTHAAANSAQQVIQAADAALASDDLLAIVQAYMRGRGVRKELKGALEAVKRAMDSYGAVLLRWQRASGDFKSAFELQPKMEAARFNGDVVDQHIAALVDFIKLMQQAMGEGEEKRKELGEKMEQLKKKLPNGMQDMGDGDDEEDSEEQKMKGPQEGQMEKPARTGREMAITPEEARRLLESLRLDVNRKLPMGDQQTGQPKDRVGKEW
jgi:hypothetical protein